MSRRAATDAYKAKNTDLGENEMAIFESLNGQTLQHHFLDPLSSTFSIHVQIIETVVAADMPFDLGGAKRVENPTAGASVQEMER